MPNLRQSLLDLPTLKHRLQTQPYKNLISDCRQYPDDPVMQIMASFWMMSEAVLEVYPNQLHYQLLGRLGIYRDLYPEIAELLNIVKQDNPGLHLTQPTLQPAYRGLHRLLRGHTKQVVGAKVLSTNRILTWSWDKTLRLWSADGELFAVMEGHTDLLKEAIELSTGRILSWSNNLHKQDTTLRLWSADGEPLAVLRGHVEDRPSDVIELPNGNILSRSHREKVCLFWNAYGQFIRKIDLEEDDGLLLVIGDRLFSYQHPVTKIYNFDGEYLGIDENILPTFISRDVIQLDNGQWVTRREMTLYFHDDMHSIHHALDLPLDNLERYIKTITKLRDGRLLVYCELYRPKEFSLYLLTSDGEYVNHVSDNTRKIRHIKELRDGRFLISMSDKALELWSSELEHLKTLQGHTGWIDDMLELEDGRLVTFCGDETIRLWTADGEALGVIGGQPDSVHCAGILADGRLVSYAHSEFSYDKIVSIWNLEADETTLPSHHTAYPYSIRELRNGRLLSCSWDGTMRIWSSDGLSIKRMWSKHMSTIYDALELSNGKILAWASNATLWDKNGELIRSLEEPVRGAIQLRSNRILIYGWEDMWICTADAIDLFKLEGHEQWVAGALELSDERILSWDGHFRMPADCTLRIWSSDGEHLATLEGHTKAILGALELRDGRILSWSVDKTLRLWSSNGNPQAVLYGHQNMIFDAFELADGRILSSYQTNNDDDENESLLWTSDGQFIRRVDEARGYVISQGRDEVYWDKNDDCLMGYQQGKVIHEFVADTTVYAYCGTSDGGVALGDFAGNVHILKPNPQINI